MGRVLTPLLLGLLRLLLRCHNHLKHDVLNSGCYTNAYEIIECSSMMQLLYFKQKCPADCPHPSGGPSAVQCCRPTRTNYLSGQFQIYKADCPLQNSGLSAVNSAKPPEAMTPLDKFLISTADCPALLGGPSAVHTANSTRDDNVSGQNSRLYGGLSALH